MLFRLLGNNLSFYVYDSAVFSLLIENLDEYLTSNRHFFLNGDILQVLSINIKLLINSNVYGK